MNLEHLNLTKSLVRGCFALLIALPLGCDSADPADSKPKETPAAKNEVDAAEKDERKGAEPEKAAVAPKPEPKPKPKPAAPKQAADKPAAAKQAPPKPVPVAFSKTQPCTITVMTKSTDPDLNLECFEIRALQVAGHAQRICFPTETPNTLEYDEQGRILDDRFYSYRHGNDGNAKSTWIKGGKPTVSKVKFDAVGRMVRHGAARYTFDEAGRLLRSNRGERFTAVKYAEDGTFVSSNNYPYIDEECEADLLVVTRNEHGQTLTEEYGGCEINETARTLTFTYDAAGRPTHIDIELHPWEEPDGSVDASIEVSYACHDAAPPGAQLGEPR